MDAQEQRTRFVPEKYWQGRLAAKVQPRKHHNENILIPQRRTARPHQRVLLRGFRRQIRTMRGVLRPRARRDRRCARASPLGELIRPGNLVSHTRGKNGPKATTEGLTPFFYPPTTQVPSTYASYAPLRRVV